jgi:lipopolysaccharide export LptBFGC system permease protein LptF
LKQPAPEESKQKLEQYRDDQQEIQRRAKESESDSSRHLAIHQVLATAVTLFQVAIAVTAISVLVRRRSLLGVSLVFGLVGLVFLIRGFLLPL